MLNTNMLRDQDDDAGFYAAGCGADPDRAWRGCVLRSSSDSGASYQTLVSIPTAAVIGEATNVMGDFEGGNVPDEINAVNVTLSGGSLSSTDNTGLHNGTFAFILGRELIYGRDATLESDGSYTISGLLRGRRGTEYAMGEHAVGDRFVLVDAAALVRVPQVTGDLNQTRLYKAVTVGSAESSAAAESFTNEGAGLKPYAPVHIGGGKNGAGDITLRWTRRGRISGEWRDGVDVPLGEASEAYEVEIYADSGYGTLKRTISGISSQSTVYTASQQTTDFGAPQTQLYFIVYQASATIGRGWPGYGHMPAPGAAVPGAPPALPPAPPAPGPTPAPAPPTAPPAAVSYPFGARTDAYGFGAKPTQVTTSPATVDALLKAQYDAWKAVAVVDNPAVSGGKAVRFSGATYLTVSEGMGYGMLLAVIFAGHDSGAQALFNGLLATVRANPAYSVVTHYTPLGAYLMDWRLLADGTSAGEGWNAMDGDEDIALALLMAHRQWGSAGVWNYQQEALNTIAALKAYNFKADGTTKGLSTPNVSRTSDYMIGHFRAFGVATGDSFWSTMAIARAYYLANLMQTVHSAGVGLMPDFIINTDTTPIPSTGYMGDGNAYEHHYWWNACRNPWRFASDYVLSGDGNWLTVTSRIIDFFEAEVAAAAGDVTAIGTGYRISDGAQLTGGDSPAYHGPILAGACVDVGYQTFLDAMWTWNAAHLTTGYYDGEIQLLSMVVASGNWWKP